MSISTSPYYLPPNSYELLVVLSGDGLNISNNTVISNIISQFIPSWYSSKNLDTLNNARIISNTIQQTSGAISLSSNYSFTACKKMNALIDIYVNTYGIQITRNVRFVPNSTVVFSNSSTGNFYTISASNVIFTIIISSDVAGSINVGDYVSNNADGMKFPSSINYFNLWRDAEFGTVISKSINQDSLSYTLQIRVPLQSS